MPLRAKFTNPAFTDLNSTRMVSTSRQIPQELPGDEPDDVLFSSLYGVRLIELNRPKKLNSLNGSMARKILPRLVEWQKSHLANVIILAGAGDKALCAGGDVAALAKQNNTPEGQKASADFFALEYTLDHLIAQYQKPYISFMDGITMGGGVGLSVHAPFRIATERTLFAMPETTIGFFPDVGGSFFLPRLDGEIGTYLALTSDRLNGRQAYMAGIATHYVHSSSLSNLTTRLSELVFKDEASVSERLIIVNNTIAEFTQPLPQEDELPPTPNGNLTGSLRKAIDRCFSKDTVPEIISELQGVSNHEEWAQKTIETLQARSPTSLKVALRQMRLGKSWSIGEAFVKEHAMATHFMRHPDFVEGVTARLIEKNRKPNWTPATLDEVDDATVEEFFKVDRKNQVALLAKGPAYYNYMDYPFVARLGLGLPREKAIKEAIKAVEPRGKASVVTPASVIDKLKKEFGDSVVTKQGLKAKIRDVMERMREEAATDVETPP